MLLRKREREKEGGGRQGEGGEGRMGIEFIAEVYKRLREGREKKKNKDRSKNGW